jgi:peptidoglycan/LPS O-acetylase OafA/YrhL
MYHHIVSIDVVRHVPYLFGQGWLGVNIFFALSGFVLFRPYLLRERALDSWDDVKAFYVRRFLRLYPLLLVSCTVSVLIKGVTLENLWQLVEIVTTLRLFLETEIAPPLNWVLWSLLVEIWFSLLFPFAVWSIERFGYMRTGFVIAVGALSVRVAGAWLYPSHGGMVMPNPLMNSFIGRFDDFFLGMIICHVFYQGPLLLHRLPFSALAIGGGAALAAIIGWDLVRYEVLPFGVVPFLYSIFQVGIFFLIMATLKGTFLLTALCRMWWLRIHGAMCYSLYVWHGALFGLLPRVWMYVLCVYIVSLVSYRVIEFGHVKDVRALFRLTSRVA